MPVLQLLLEGFQLLARLALVNVLRPNRVRVAHQEDEARYLSLGGVVVLYLRERDVIALRDTAVSESQDADVDVHAVNRIPQNLNRAFRVGLQLVEQLHGQAEFVARLLRGAAMFPQVANRAADEYSRGRGVCLGHVRLTSC